MILPKFAKIWSLWALEQEKKQCAACSTVADVPVHAYPRARALAPVHVRPRTALVPIRAARPRPYSLRTAPNSPEPARSSDDLPVTRHHRQSSATMARPFPGNLQSIQCLG
jgi:hypothetical protein